MKYLQARKKTIVVCVPHCLGVLGKESGSLEVVEVTFEEELRDIERAVTTGGLLPIDDSNTIGDRQVEDVVRIQIKMNQRECGAYE